LKQCFSKTGGLDPPAGGSCFCASLHPASRKTLQAIRMLLLFDIPPLLVGQASGRQYYSTKKHNVFFAGTPI
jgi:hypothetical protein